MAMLGGGEEIAAQCRKPEIMADAAYWILSQGKDYTGNFAIDDEVLNAAGVRDMEQYACVPGSNLLPDFFLDVGPEALKSQIEAGGLKPAFGGAPKAVQADSVVGKVFKQIEAMMSEDMVKSINGVFQFNLTGANAGDWFVDFKTGKGQVGQGASPGEAGCTMIMDSADFVKMFAGELKPTTAFMMGKLKIKGDMALAMKLEKLMIKMRSNL
ncbi:hypothetical protein DPMN_081156 [Dreissena polymorpha]|uniref:SCP2 domain-containing protein n=2 Tax=Dreissena polymorpha TaxID=45954 RepID=A0A9D3Y7I5_DREPO|nr:hypothetical protein DPMN_081156 [Dreissena polymorpha]